MPSDSNGNYSLPAGYLAITGQTIQASQHNPPLEDLATSMTLRVMATGVTPFTGPVKAADGTATAPSITFNSALSLGFYKTAGGGIGVAGSLLGLVPVGTVVDYAGAAAPTGWILCFGQPLLQSAYPALFAALGGASTPYGFDATHFNLPDCRGAVTAGNSDMGGVDRGNLVNGGNLGAYMGTQAVTLDTTQIPAHNHTGTTDNGGADHTHIGPAAPPSTSGQFQGLISPNNGWGGVPGTTATGNASAYLHQHSFTTNNTGGGGSHTNVQPTIVLNKIIFAGV